MAENKAKFDTVEAAIEDLKKGIPVVVVDDEDRENEGDLIIPAQVATYEWMNFIINEARGLMCVPVSHEVAKRLMLDPMTHHNTDHHGTAFTISVDAAEGTTTGISVADRLKTVLDLANPNKKPEDFLRPGHMFPLIAKENGVLERRGHTEAAVDLARLAGFEPVAVIMEMLNHDGTMARRDDLFAFCQKHNLKIITVDELIVYIKKNEKLVKNEATVDIPTQFGKFTFSGYSDKIDHKEYIAVMKGEIKNKENGYQLIKRSGFVNSSLYSEQAEKRKQVYMLSSGSVLSFKPEGKILDLKLHGKHSIYRMGKPIVLGVKI